MNINDISPEALRRAAVLRERIQQLQVELASTLEIQPGNGTVRPRRKITQEGLTRMRAAQRKRWAKTRKGIGKRKSQPKRKMSREARAKISAIAKARWAAAKRAGKSAL